MTVVEPAAHSDLRERRIQYFPLPELDQGHVGLTLIGATFGFVLAAVFGALAHSFSTANQAGVAQLALAAVTVVLSWAGFYANRVAYPIWKVRIFNVPFFQYVLSVGLALLYYGLATTAEVPPSAFPLRGTVGSLPKGIAISLDQYIGRISANPESILLFIIFIVYLAWDILEVVVLASAAGRGRKRFQRGLVRDLADEQARAHHLNRAGQRALRDQLNDLLADNSGATPANKLRDKLHSTIPAGPATWNASDVMDTIADAHDLLIAQVLRTLVTVAFTIVFGLFVLSTARSSTVDDVRGVDTWLIVFLTLYRAAQGVVRRSSALKD